MQKTLFFKLGIIGLLCLLLIIPLSMIDSKISERSRYHSQVKNDMAQGWSGNQEVVGPVLIVPYRTKTFYSQWDENLKKYIQKPKYEQHTKLLFPASMNINAEVETEERYRGIYSIPVYKSHFTLEGQFLLPKNLGVDDWSKVDRWGQPFLSMGIKDLKGVTSEINVLWGQQEYPAKPGSSLEFLPSGIHVALKLGDIQNEMVVPFVFNFGLRGMDILKVVPVAENTTIKISSSWPHPSFIGRYADNRQVSEKGFSADWSVSSFSTNIEEKFSDCFRSKISCYSLDSEALGVEFILPVDTYHITERATKYGLLFVFLVFGAFFLFEVLKSLSVHPIQYLLVGLALAMFFQMLLSLSEHISFGYAYIGAAFSSILLIVFYVSYVLKSFLRSSVLGAALTLIYALLYMILKSEDHSLLMGTLLLMSALAVFMFATRKVDWYGLGMNANSSLDQDKASSYSESCDQ